MIRRLTMAKTIKQKYEELSEELSELKISKARAETTKEANEKNRDKALDSIEKIAGTRDIKKAKAKLEKLEAKLDEYLEEAEGIIDA